MKSKKKNFTGTKKNTSSDFLVKSLSNVKISEENFSTIFNLLKKTYKKKAYFIYNINKKQTLSKKSQGMRMGKGKGSKKKTIYLINKGGFFLEVNKSKLRTKKDFILFIKILKRKLSCNIQCFYEKNIFLNL